MTTALVASVLALLATPPQENAEVRNFLAMQMSEAVRSAPISAEDANGMYRITAIQHGNCRSTIRAGNRSWDLNWRTVEGVEAADPTFFMVHSAPPVAFIVDENASGGTEALEKLRRAMDRVWNLCE